jgi:hypothetical protein
VQAQVSGPAAPLPAGSEVEFVTEHYWGYTRQRDGNTLEYRVRHPSWTVWTARSARLSGSVGATYPDFAAVLARPHHSAYVATGSEVAVFPGRRLEAA